MKRNHWMGLFGAALIVYACGFAFAETGSVDAGSSDAIAEVSPLGVTFAGTAAKAGMHVTVRINGPLGETVFEAASSGGLVDWYPDPGLADGVYRYDFWVVPEAALDGAHQRGPIATEESPLEKNAELRGTYGTGMLRLQGGMIVEHSADAAGAQWLEVTSRDSFPPPGPVARVAANVLEWLVPQARATDVIVSDPTPEVRFQDTSGGTTDDWIILGYDGSPPLFGIGQTLFPQFAIFGGAPIGSLVIGSNGNIGIGTDSPATNTDIHVVDSFPVLRFEDSTQAERQIWELFADDASFSVRDVKTSGQPFPFLIQPAAPTNSLVIEGTTGDVGFGTNTPARALHVVDALHPFLRLERSGGDFWELESNDSFFDINRNGIRHLTLNDVGNLGLGDDSPNAPLHVRRFNGTAQVLVEDMGSTSPLPMFVLRNNGSIRFTMANTTGHNWAFSTGSAGFSISRAGTGPEMLVRNNGNVEISGDVTANGVLLTSSREVKTDFSQVDEHTILEKVAALDVSQWRYKREPGSERHIGPMAEDFHQVFGLGDGRHISAGDANGILFAAAKALKAENDSLKAELYDLRELRMEVAELRASMEALRERR